MVFKYRYYDTFVISAEFIKTLAFYEKILYFFFQKAKWLQFDYKTAESIYKKTAVCYYYNTKHIKLEEKRIIFSDKTH